MIQINTKLHVYVISPSKVEGTPGTLVLLSSPLVACLTNANSPCVEYAWDTDHNPFQKRIPPSIIEKPAADPRVQHHIGKVI